MDDISVSTVRALLKDPSWVRENPFAVLQALSVVTNQEDVSEVEVQELILRTLEHRSAFGTLRPILDAMVRELGLFPYLEDVENLSFADRLAYEFHRPLNMAARDIVFHRPQAYVYRELMNGKNVVLSAPTSFGKSLIIDAIIASGKFQTILVVVPSIALIDETRRRLSTFSESYNLITHPGQRLGERNILIFTQERVLEFTELDCVDFFVIDEFYKLSPSTNSDGRSALLNHAFYELARRGKQFYMLGPSVTGVSPDLERKLEFIWISEPYHTVVSEMHRIDPGNDEMLSLATLCNNLTGPTIIFCKSPPRAADVVRALISHGVSAELPPEMTRLREGAVDWIGKNYHSDWHVAQALRHGIGVHHGRIPRALAQFIVRCFEEDRIRFLVCTSTLIEGVNTKAENIIILDDKIDRRKYDFFTFNNIRGRSGRMFRHFVGHVYLFHDPPPERLPLVEIPAFTQSDTAPASLLLQLDESDLEARSKERLKPFSEQGVLSYAVLKANIGVDPEAQIGVAKEISTDLFRAHDAMLWTGFPTYDQLLYVCELIWKHFGGARLGAGSARSAAQLTVRIRKLIDAPFPSELVRAQLPYSKSPDEAVQNVLDFLRLWANFHFPRLLLAIDRIQRDVFGRFRLPPGNYEVFAKKVENYFLDPALVALDEYGVPTELARRMVPVLGRDLDLDAMLSRLASLDIDRVGNLSDFERELLRDAKRYI